VAPLTASAKAESSSSENRRTADVEEEKTKEDIFNFSQPQSVNWFDICKQY
jgi:hypothetical protein